MHACAGGRVSRFFLLLQPRLYGGSCGEFNWNPHMHAPLLTHCKRHLIVTALVSNQSESHAHGHGAASCALREHLQACLAVLQLDQHHVDTHPQSWSTPAQESNLSQCNHLLTHLLTYSLTNLLTHSLANPLTHPLTHSPTYSLTHSLTHPTTQALVGTTPSSTTLALGLTGASSWSHTCFG